MTSRRFIRNERGQSVVEFAISAMLFFLFLFGIIELGLAVYRYNMVSNLAQEGARRAIVCGGGSVLPSGCDIEAYVISRSPIPLDSVVVTPDPPSSALMGDTVSVQVIATSSVWQSIVPSGAITVQSTAQMVVAR